MSFDSFYLISKVVSPGCLLHLIDPLKETMRTAATMKVRPTAFCLALIYGLDARI